MNRRSLPVLGFAILGTYALAGSACVVPTTNCPALPADLNSGKNDSTGALQAQWTTDDTWEGFNMIYNGGTPLAATVETTSVNDTLMGVSPALPGSTWLKPIINANIASWEYTTEFCLNTGFTNAQLQLSVIARDQAEILLNGVQVAAPGGSMVSPNSALVTNQALFVDGWNSVSVRVSNARYINAIASIAGSITADMPFDEPDLKIHKQLVEERMRFGSQANYQIRVKNLGADMAMPPITVTDVLPTGMTYDSFQSPSTAWSCTASGQTVTCVLNLPLTSGAIAPDLTIRVNTGASTAFPPGTEFVDNCASVSHPLDIDASNDQHCTQNRIY